MWFASVIKRSFVSFEDLKRAAATAAAAAAAAAALPAAADQSWLAGHDLQENYSRFDITQPSSQCAPDIKDMFCKLEAT